jgi:ribonuclease T2
MEMPNGRALAAILTCLLISAGIAPAQSSGSGNFSPYMLVLSDAPDFCSEPGGQKDARECGSGRRIGFIVHGLWPENDSSRAPENCGGSPVSQAIIQATLNYIPVPSLIQHEWKTHGTCTGLTAADFFAALRKARDSVNVPADLNQPSQQVQLSPADVEGKLAAANPTFPAAAFRTSCYRDGKLQEIRVCLNKDLSPRACGSSAGECSLPTITMLPVH